MLIISYVYVGQPGSEGAVARSPRYTRPDATTRILATTDGTLLLAPLRRLYAGRLVILLGVMRRPGRILLAFGFLPRGQIEQRLQRAFRRVDPLVRIADLRESIGNGLQRERFRLDGGHLVPRQRRGNPRVRRGPHRVRGRDGAVL